MSRRPAVLLTPPPAISNSSLFFALLHKSEAHPQSFQPLPHSLCVYPGAVRRPYFLTSLNPYFAPVLTPLEATLTADLRVLPCFGRDCPPATPLDATLTDLAPVTPLSATLTKNPGEGWPQAKQFPHSDTSLRFSSSPAPRQCHGIACREFRSITRRTASSPAAVRRPALRAHRHSPVLYFLYFLYFPYLLYLLFHPTRYFLFTNGCGGLAFPCI
jgi:hypothetical protein